MDASSFWFVEDDHYFVDEDGIIRREEIDDKTRRALNWWELEEAFQNQILEETGYHIQPIYFNRFVESFVDRKYDDMIAELKKRAVRSAQTKAATPSRKESQEAWNKLRVRFNGFIIGIDKQYYNTHPAGFSIHVLMKSESIEDRKRFVAEHQEDILRWCMEEIPGQKHIIRRIGSIDYYTPTEIVVLEGSVMEVFFDVKGDQHEKDANAVQA